MRFSGVAKVGVLETQDGLHCRCLINITAQPADAQLPCLSPCPPTDATLRRRHGGHNLTFCHSPASGKNKWAGASGVVPGRI